MRQAESTAARGRALVVSTWTQEAAEDRAAFLLGLDEGLSLEDEPFLESALDDRSKLVRRAAADLLARLPDSAFCRRMIERALPLLTFSKPKPRVFSITKPGLTIEVEPPSSCDRAMVRDGIELKPLAGMGERASWLQQVVAATPLFAWCRHAGETPDPIVAAIGGGEWEELLWNAWASATYRLRNPSWAGALLAHLPRGSGAVGSLVGPLLTILTSEQRDAYLIKGLRSDPNAARPGPSRIRAAQPARTPARGCAGA